MVFPCPICGKVFSVKTNYYRHRRRFHGITAANNAPPVLVTFPASNIHSVEQQAIPASQSRRMPPLIDESDNEDDTDQPTQPRKNTFIIRIDSNLENVKIQRNGSIITPPSFIVI